MNEFIQFLTSKTGLFAALVAIVGLVAAVAGLIRPTLDRRRAARAAKAALTLTEPFLSELSASSNSYDLHFEITNSGGSSAVAVAVRLRVLQRLPCTAFVPSFTEAPLRVNRHRVKIQADKDLYDVRARAYGSSAPPLAFAATETEAFVVKLVSDESQHYSIRIEVEWYDAKSPGTSRTAHSLPVDVDFPPREARRAPPT